MEMYKISVLPRAIKSLINIEDYIFEKLRSPEAAENTVTAISKAINGLDFMPQRYATLPGDFLERDNVRRMQVKKYFVYYSIDEDTKIVNILDVMYVGREQREQLSDSEDE